MTPRKPCGGETALLNPRLGCVLSRTNAGARSLASLLALFTLALASAAALESCASAAPPHGSASPLASAPDPQAPSSSPLPSSSPASSASASAAPSGVASSEPAPAETSPPLDVVYWPTPQVVVDRMLELAAVKPSDVIYDLGCGDARSLVTAAKKYGARGFGFDIDPRRVEEARRNVSEAGVESLVTIEQADIFTLDLSPASVVFLFLLTKLNDRLVPQLEQLRPGSRVVSHEFDMPRVNPARVVHLSGPPDGPPETDPSAPASKHTLYLWKLPWQRRPAPPGSLEWPE